MEARMAVLMGSHLGFPQCFYYCLGVDGGRCGWLISTPSISAIVWEWTVALMGG